MKPKIAAEYVRAVLKNYAAGRYTKLETLSRLDEAAVVYEPSELAAELSPEWLQPIREHNANPPQSASEIIYISPAGDCEAGQKRAFEASWRWHRYFKSLDESTTPQKA